MQEKMNYNVSIIVPHYNSPMLLEKLLTSIPDRGDIQTIVVDDNSTKEVDEYKKLKNKFSHKVEFYLNDTGVQSAGACRNIGLEYAKGMWIMFADADDYFLPNMYECISEFFQSEYEMVIFTPTSVFLDTEEIADRHITIEKRIEQYLGNPTYKNLLNVKKIEVPWSRMIRRSVIEKNQLRFSETLYANDVYFGYKINYCCCRIIVSHQKIYCVTRNRGSLTTKVTEQAIDIRIQEYIKCYKFIEERYSREDVEQFNFNGAHWVFKAFKYKLGLKKILQIIFVFRKNKVPLITNRMKNPIYLMQGLYINNKKINKSKKYYVKDED